MCRVREVAPLEPDAYTLMQEAYRKGLSRRQSIELPSARTIARSVRGPGRCGVTAEGGGRGATGCTALPRLGVQLRVLFYQMKPCIRSLIFVLAVAACATGLIPSQACAKSSSEINVRPRLDYIVLLSRDHHLSDTNWSRITSGTAFVAARRPSKGALTFQGPLGDVVLTLQHEPLSADGFGAVVQKHAATLCVNFRPSSTRLPDRVSACAALLCILSQAQDAMGVLNMTTGRYVPVRFISPFVGRHSQNDPRLLRLLIDVHATHEEHGTEAGIHTHGMSQFALPEIEIWVKGHAQPSDTERILKVADYEMLGQRTLKTGDILSLPTLDAVYRIAKARPQTERDEPFFSAIQLIQERGRN